MLDSALASKSDEELVFLARRGEQSAAAISELLRRLSPLLRQRAFAFARNEADRQDYYQEGVVGFLSAVHTYKVGCGARFSTYACTCAVNRMRNLLRQRSKGSEYAMVSLETDDEIAGVYPDPQQLTQAQDEVEQVLERIETSLSSFEKNVLRLYLGGLSYAEAAQSLGTNAKAVDNAMQRIRRKLSR